MAKIQVRVSGEQVARYSQVVEMDEDDYEKIRDLLDADDNELASELICDYLELTDPYDWDDFECDGFERA